MRHVSISAWAWRIGEPSWRDPHAPPPNPDQVAMIGAAVSAGWHGLTSFVDRGGLRCVAANGQEIAVVTLAGCTFEEAGRVAEGSRSLRDWSIAAFRRLLAGPEPRAGNDHHIH